MSENHSEMAPFAAPEGYGNVDELLQGVSEGMSEITRLLAVVAGPSVVGDALSRVDYLPLPQGDLLLVVSMESGVSSTASVKFPVQVDEDELREIFASLNSWLGGRPAGTDLELSTVARKVLSDHNPLVIGAVLQAIEVLGRATDRGFFIQGVSALLARLDDLDPASLAAVIQVFERRRWLLNLMSDALQRSVLEPSGVVVSIGAESGFYNLQPRRPALRCRESDRPQTHGVRRGHIDGPLRSRNTDLTLELSVLRYGRQARLLRSPGRAARLL
jgi:heat-inducible transcriptional repressor